MTPQKSPWQIETLFRNAFARTKDRFLSYLIATIIQYVILIAVVFGLFIIGGLLVAVFGLSAKGLGGSGILIGGALMALLVFIGIVVVMYIASWGQLAVVTTIINKTKISATDTFKLVKPRVWGMIWLNIGFGLFFIGLMPFGILTLGVLFVVWSAWSSMYVFVYLQQNRTGLDNAWVSKQMVQPNFWKVLSRMAVLYGLFYIIFFALSSLDNNVSGLLSMVISLFFTPFAMSYSFEIYNLLTVPTTVQRPTLWIFLSIGGFVLIVLGMVLMGGAIFQAIQGALKTSPSNPYPSYPTPQVNTQYNR